MDELALEFDVASHTTSATTGRLKKRPQRVQMMAQVAQRKAVEARDLHTMTAALEANTNTLARHDPDAARQLAAADPSSKSSEPAAALTATTTTYTSSAFKQSITTTTSKEGTTITLPKLPSQFKAEGTGGVVTVEVPGSIGVFQSALNGSVTIGSLSKGHAAGKTMVSASSFFRSRGLTSQALAKSHGAALGALAAGKVGDAVHGLSMIGRSVPTSAAVYCSMGVIYDNDVLRYHKTWGDELEMVTEESLMRDWQIFAEYDKSAGLRSPNAPPGSNPKPYLPEQKAVSTTINPISEKLTTVQSSGSSTVFVQDVTSRPSNIITTVSNAEKDATIAVRKNLDASPLSAAARAATMAYYSYLYAAQLCKKDFTIWMRCGDSAVGV
jgi:hypothetical protein